MDEKIIYSIIALAAGGLVLMAMLSVFAVPGDAQPAPGISIPPECGDINNAANLQHLSHHPDRFQDCYRVVDPAKFKAATGQDVSNFIR